MFFHLSDLGLYVISLKRDFLIIILAKADLLYYSLGLFPSQDITICNFFFFFWTPWSVKIGTISVCSDIFFFSRGKVMKYMSIARLQMGGIGNLRALIPF